MKRTSKNRKGPHAGNTHGPSTCDAAIAPEQPKINGDPHDLGYGFSISFGFDGGKLTCQWSPRVPFGKRARQLLPAYRRARHEFLTDASQRLGIAVALVELGDVA